MAMWNDFSLYVNFEGRELLLKTLSLDASHSAQVPLLHAKINQDEVEYADRSLSLPDLESFINIPLGLLNKIGLIDSERFMAFTQRRGTFPNEHKGDAHLYYHLYVHERQQKAFLLQHEIPSPPVVAEQPNHQQVIGKDFSDIPPEEYIQIYGCMFRIKKNEVTVKRGMIYVPWKYKFKRIPLYPLLATKLTTIETIQTLGGKRILNK